MAVYRKKLVDKDGNTIIPAIGDIYGPVYTASLQSSSGGIATYTFTPDTPVEANRVYAVKFPTPTVNNATIILGDGTTSASVLVPPVAATDSPNYELLDTTMINDTEPLLLMYNGVQWVCLNQKKKAATADLEDSAVTSNKIDWSTIPTVPYNWMSLAGVSLPSGWANWVPIDVTNIPTGRKFVILFSFWYRGPSGIANGWVACRSGYNGTYGGYAYSSQPGTEVLNGASGLTQYTKVAGVNTVYLQLVASNTTALSDGQVQGTAIF